MKYYEEIKVHSFTLSAAKFDIHIISYAREREGSTERVMIVTFLRLYPSHSLSPSLASNLFCICSAKSSAPTAATARAASTSAAARTAPVATPWTAPAPAPRVCRYHIYNGEKYFLLHEKYLQVGEARCVTSARAPGRSCTGQTAASSAGATRTTRRCKQIFSSSLTFTRVARTRIRCVF